jgi:hypothetical protein
MTCTPGGGKRTSSAREIARERAKDEDNTRKLAREKRVDKEKEHRNRTSVEFPIVYSCTQQQHTIPHSLPTPS